jgi:molybdate/tungstate transport system substrate-binding protein
MPLSLESAARPRRRWGALLAVALALAAACGDGAARKTPDSAAGRAVADTAPDPARRASDATLALLDAADLGAALRAATDSFGAREAVRVVHRVDGPPGSMTLADSSLGGARAPDVVVADAALFPRRIVPGRATWYAPFAGDRVVIAYRDSSARAATVDSASWWKVLTRRGVRVARADPATDASGRDALLAMQLAERKYESRGLAAKLRASASLVRSTRAALVALLRADSADYIWTYESVAADAGLRTLRLPHEVFLGAASDSAISPPASITLPRAVPTVARDSLAAPRDSLAAPADSIVVRGAPIAYAISIPLDAPNPSVAARFVRFLLSEQGRRALRQAHLDVPARVIAIGSGVPAPVAAAVDSVALPADSTAAQPLAP